MDGGSDGGGGNREKEKSGQTDDPPPVFPPRTKCGACLRARKNKERVGTEEGSVGFPSDVREGFILAVNRHTSTGAKRTAPHHTTPRTNLPNELTN